MSQAVLNGNTYTDDGTNRYLDNGGHRTNFFLLLNDLLAVVATATSAPGTAATSVTSVAIGTGAKSFTIETGKSISPGAWMLIADDAAPTANWMFGNVTSYDTATGALVMNITLIGGSGTKIAWTLSLSGPVGGYKLTRSARTANTILAADDRATLIDATANTWTQTLTAAATLTSGWWCYFKNSGTGIITINPDGSETIDGLTSIKVYPGEEFAIQCDASAFYTMGRSKLVKLGTTTVGGAVGSVDMEDGFTDTEIVGVEVDFTGVSGASTTTPTLRLKLAGAYSALNYIYNGVQVTTTTVSGNNSVSDTSIVMTSNNINSAASINGSISVRDIQTATNGNHTVEARLLDRGGTTGRSAHVLGCNSAGSAVQGLRFMWTSGNVDAGTFTWWGRRA